MASQTTINLLRGLFIIFTFFLGMRIGDAYGWEWQGGAGGLIFGLVIVLFDRLLKGVSLRLFSSATFGLVMGLICARLLLASDVLEHTSDDLKWAISLAVYAAAAYLGTMLAFRSNREDFSLIIPYVRFQPRAAPPTSVLIDSNIAIDGRIKEICATGFLSHSLIVPRFVLNELQLLADSHDPLKRERGLRGLNCLQEMQSARDFTVTIHEGDADAANAANDEPVDQKLIKLASLHDARLLTNDANLCRIARLQNISVLNLHDLNRALRPPVFTGEELELPLVKEGREAHQAVGYLPDGTMIVVNHANRHLGETAVVTIISSLQTSAGRLFFAELKNTPRLTNPASAHNPEDAPALPKNLGTPPAAA